MFFDSQFDCFDPSVAQLIRRKAKSLVGKSGITRSDVPDVEQHLALCLFKAMQAYDRDRGHLMAWAVTIVERCIATLLEHLRAGVRDWRRSGASLDEPHDDGDGACTSLGASVSDEDARAHRGHAPKSAEHLSELEMDVAAILGALAPELRDICERLKAKPLAHVAKDLGVSRTALYERLSTIRERFVAEDMRDYL